METESAVKRRSASRGRKMATKIILVAAQRVGLTFTKARRQKARERGRRQELRKKKVLAE